MNVECSLRFPSILALLLAPALSALSSAEPAPRFLGAASCSSSSCHGGAGENRHQYTIWTKLDFHHERPYATLTTARSEQIARVLKISEPTQDTRCTACHAPLQTVPAARLAPDVRVTEGVSCESCHGAAEPWLRSHTRPDYSHRDRVHTGMRDLKNLYVRANSCVACHQNVDADLLRAGHPELIFELDGQSVTQPRHWRVTKDKPGPQIWLVGQAVALREMSWQLSRETSPTENEIARWKGLIWLVYRASAVEPGLPAPPDTNFRPSPENFVKAQDWSDALAKTAATIEWTESLTRNTLAALADPANGIADPVGQPVQARRAERLVLALDRLVTASPDATARKLSPLVDALFKEVQSLPDFDAARFAGRLQEIELALKGR